METNSNLAIVCSDVFKTSETFITRHIRELAPGHTVVVCFSDSGKDKVNCPVHCVSRSKSTLPWFLSKPYKASNLLLHGQTNPIDGEGMKSLCEFFKKQRVRAILAEFGTLGVLMQPVAQKMGIPLFVYFRGFDASRLLNNWRIRYSYRRLLPKAAGIIYVSRALADNLESIGFSHPNTHIIPSGVDVDLFIPGQPECSGMALAVGRFVEKKAPHHTIKAFASIADQYPNARLEMVGEGALFSQCRSLVEELGIGEKIILHGAREHEFVQRKMAEAAMFVQHSVTTQDGDTEGLPTAIQEAMATGLPVVSTRHSGIPEAVLEGNTGFLVDEHDVEGMGRAMGKLLSNPSLRERMGKAGRKRAVEHFSCEKLLARLRKVMGLSKLLEES